MTPSVALGERDRARAARFPRAYKTTRTAEDEGGRLRDASGIACPSERPATEGRAGATHQGRLLAKLRSILRSIHAAQATLVTTSQTTGDGIPAVHDALLPALIRQSA